MITDALRNIWNDHDFLSTVLTLIALIIVTWVFVSVKRGWRRNDSIERFAEEKKEETAGSTTAASAVFSRNPLVLLASLVPEVEKMNKHMESLGSVGPEVVKMNARLSEINSSIKSIATAILLMRNDFKK